MRVLLAVAALVVGVASVFLEDLEFQEWKLKFGKIYQSEEEEAGRKMIWLTNRKLVLEHNMLADQGLKSYRLSMNHFADMDNQEYRQMLKGCLGSFNRTKTRNATAFFRQAGGAALPDTVDWRDKGYVTAVKDQGYCGSCWAFSVTGALEGQMFRKVGYLVSLSEQQLVDCSIANLGCSGGWLDRAFEYVRDNGGLDTEQSYPYMAADWICRFNPATIGATCTGYEYASSGDELALQEAVATIGPISVAIDAGDSFQLYKSGVYNEPYCSSSELNHAVLVVGYGTEDGQDYWLVKNSWGVEWGEKGYIKMSRNRNNQCGIATDALYPLHYGMRVLLAVAALVAVAGAASVTLEDLEFQEWKLQFDKTYHSVEEEAGRKMTWLTNRKLVLEHNKLADQGLKSYRLGMNHFADMDDQEYEQMFKGCLRPFNRTKTRSAAKFLQQMGNAALPYSVDWRDMGYVTDVKTQGHCASCWAFSAVGALEGQMFRKTGNLTPLSAQQLVDCSWLYGNDGCGGGSMELAFEYINASGGLQPDAVYPYKAREGLCMYNPRNALGKCYDFEELQKEDEEELQKAVVAVGPISAAIDSSNKTFLLYQSGIYNEPSCSSFNVNHGVLVVGYNTDSSGRDYWVVKNSWGVQWGEKGYIRMSRNKDNQCGIATRASFPLV
ncbi:uncharacterized protein [Salminus brasiliensis]|uniref:uncharacterized protein n=1 Tax=Salminus brasiliensis TaxID=930266 RepID=UPI003B837966